jgi:hypothetical protein
MADMATEPSENPTEAVLPAFAAHTNEYSAGSIIGPHHLLQLIGEGGMGLVWLAEQTQPVQRRVAIKLIKAGMDTREVVGRFESEPKNIALLAQVNAFLLLCNNQQARLIRTRSWRSRNSVSVEGKPRDRHCHPSSLISGLVSELESKNASRFWEKT